MGTNSLRNAIIEEVGYILGNHKKNIELWMTSENRALDGRSPDEAIKDGDGKLVLSYLLSMRR